MARLSSPSLRSFVFLLASQATCMPLLDSIVKTVSNVVTPVTGTVTGTVGSAVGNVTSIVNNATSTVTNVTNTLTDALQITGPYSLQGNASLRSAGILLKQTNFLYGPPIAGGPYFPTGALGLAKIAADQALIDLEQVPQNALIGVDVVSSTASAFQYNGLKTLDDYVSLYKNQLRQSLPNGPEVGALTNFTQDLFFSMERLTNSPYMVRRLYPSSDTLQFTVDDSIVTSITGLTLQQLFQAGRLFYADYRAHKDLVKTLKYAAACDAYFYIDPTSGQFLPLAIRTNVGANLIYTPKDAPNDWLLAKMMYNVNDFFFAQTAHLAGTHEVVQIAYMAAIRTLGENHPLLGVLNRLMYQVFAIQPLALAVLFTPGTVFDLVFPWTGLTSMNYSSGLYTYGSQGLFRSNYFYSNLQNRGLINSTLGPNLSSFPFLEDGSVIFASLKTFMTSFVSSYYSSDAVVKGDAELQAWVKEAQGPAGCRDFPNIQTVADLVDVMTHFAHLVSVSHHTVNTNDILAISATLPFHPLALFKEPPTAKGVTNVVPWLPPLEQVLLQFTSGGLFSRPLLRGSDRTLVHMFDDQAMLGRLNSQTRSAAAKFMTDMLGFSDVVSSKKFDANGLSQGTPFVWKALDPNVIPWSVSI